MQSTWIIKLIHQCSISSSTFEHWLEMLQTHNSDIKTLKSFILVQLQHFSKNFGSLALQFMIVWNFHLRASVGRRGLVGLYVYPWRQGSAGQIPVFLFLLFVPNLARRSVRYKKKRKRTKWPATKRVASAGAANWRRKTGRRFRNGYVMRKAFGSFRRLLNG